MSIDYAGDLGNQKFGAEVIARSGGNFQINFLPGGLRGEGGEYAKRIEATGVKAP